MDGKKGVLDIKQNVFCKGESGLDTLLELTTETKDRKYGGKTTMTAYSKFDITLELSVI